MSFCTRPDKVYKFKINVRLTNIGLLVSRNFKKITNVWVYIKYSNLIYICYIYVIYFTYIFNYVFDNMKKYNYIYIIIFI